MEQLSASVAPRTVTRAEVDNKQGSTIDLIWTSRMATPRRSVFRPCIDLHDGRVKQIVGGTLSDHDTSGLKTNFISKSVCCSICCDVSDDRPQYAASLLVILRVSIKRTVWKGVISSNWALEMTQLQKRPLLHGQVRLPAAFRSLRSLIH
jgi:hypothetical protein